MFNKLFIESGLSLDRLRTFVTVADAGSYAAAARGDLVRQSQFSHQVSGLEAFFGVALFERRGRSICLTPAGRKLQRLATQNLRELEAFKYEEHDRHLHLVIGTGGSVQEFLLDPIIPRLFETYPDLSVEVRQMSSRDCLAAVMDYKVDLAISTVPRTSKGLFIQPLVQSELRAICAASDPFGVAGRKQLKLLSACPHILIAGDGSMRRAIEEVFCAKGLSLNTRAELTGLGAVLRLAERGVGLAYVPSYCLRASDAMITSWRVPPISLIRRDLVMYYREDRARNAKLIQATKAITSLIAEL